MADPDAVPGDAGTGSAVGDDAGDRARLQGWRRWFTAVYGALGVIVLAAVAIGALGAAHRHPGRPVHWWLVAVVAVLVVALVGGVRVVAWRVQSRPGRTRQLLAAGNWRTNRRVGIELRRGRQIAPADRRTAQALVDLYAHRRWVVWFYAAFGVFWLGLAWFGYHVFQLGLHIALGLFYLAATPYWVIVRHKTLQNGVRQALYPTDTSQQRPQQTSPTP